MAFVDFSPPAKEEGGFIDFAKPAEPRSLLKEVPVQAYAGATIDLPKQVGQALQWMSEPGQPVYEKGRAIAEWAEGRENENPDLAAQTEGRGLIGRALSSGARALAPSLAVMAPAAAAAPLGLPAAAGAAAVGAFGIFGAAQAQETYDKLLKSGVPEADARKAGWINLMIEGGGETIGDIAGLKLFGTLAKAAGTPVAAAIKGATDSAVAMPFLKQLGKTGATEIATEFGQNFGEAWVENRFGAQANEDPLHAGVQGAEAALGMTLLLAPFGLAGFAQRAKRNEKVANALTDADAPEAMRIAAGRIIFDEIHAVNPEAAKAWGQNVTIAIAAKAPVILDESTTEGLQQHQPRQRLLAAPQPIIAGAEAPAAAAQPVVDPEALEAGRNTESARRGFFERAAQATTDPAPVLAAGTLDEAIQTARDTVDSVNVTAQLKREIDVAQNGRMVLEAMERQIQEEAAFTERARQAEERDAELARLNVEDRTRTQRDVLAGMVARGQGNGPIAQQLRAALGLREVSDDRQNTAGLPGEVGVGQKPLQAGPEQGTGGEAPGAGRVLQAQGGRADRQPAEVSAKIPTTIEEAAAATAEHLEAARNLTRSGPTRALIDAELQRRQAAAAQPAVAAEAVPAVQAAAKPAEAPQAAPAPEAPAAPPGPMAPASAPLVQGVEQGWVDLTAKPTVVPDAKLFGRPIAEATDRQLQAALKHRLERVREAAGAEIARRQEEAKARTVAVPEGDHEALRHMAANSGHLERGGQLIRTVVPNRSLSGGGVSEQLSRTQWLGQPPWAKGYTQTEVKAAVERAIAGKPMGEKQRALVEAMQHEVREMRANIAAAGAITLTPSQEVQASRFADAVVEVVSGAWATMTEAEKDAELDKFFGPQPARGAAEAAPRQGAGEGTATGQAEARQEVSAERQPGEDDEVAAAERPSLDNLKVYARGVVGPEISRVYLVGSAAKAANPRDIDLLYELNVELGDDPEGAIIEAVERSSIDAERYDTFYQVGERYFHLSSGAGRSIVENTDYAKDQAGKAKVLLAEHRGALELSPQTETDLRAKERQAAEGSVEERAAAVRDRNAAILSSPEGTAPARDVGEQKVPTQQASLLNENSGVYNVAREPLPDAARANRARADEGAQQFDLFAARPLPGVQGAQELYATVAEPTEVRKVAVGVERVNSAEDAAHVLSYLRKSPQERFVALVTDADGKPLAVLPLSVGARSETSAYPGEAAQAVHQVPGAKVAWFAHNHPSGTVGESSADRAMARNIEEVFNDTGIEVHQIVISGRRAALFGGAGHVKQFDIPALPRKHEISVQERKIKKSGTLGNEPGIHAPGDAMALARRLFPDTDGILLLDSQMRPVAWVPMHPGDIGLLRDKEGQASRLFRAMGKANASRAMLVVATPDSVSQPDVRNLSNFMVWNQAELMDVVFRDPEYTGTAQQRGWEMHTVVGEKSRRATFFSRPPRSQHTGAGMTREAFDAALERAFGAKTAARLLDQRLIIPIATQTEVPEHVVPFLRHGDTVYGFYDPKADRAYAVLENLSAADVRGLVLHEVGVHYGFERMLGPEKYARAMKRLEAMRRLGNRQVLAAHETALAEAAEESQVAEETLAYLIQHHPQMSFLQEVIAAIKAFLYREFGIGAESLTDADLAMLARAAVMKAGLQEAAPELVPAMARTGNENLSRLAMANRRMGEMVDLYEKGKLKPEESTHLGETSWVAQLLGAPNHSLYISGDTVIKILKDKEGKHGYQISPEVMRQMPEQLLEPLMVFDPERAEERARGALVVVTQFTDRTGKPVIAPIHVNKPVGGRAGRGGVIANELASVYGREEGMRQLESWANQGLLRYYDRGKVASPSTTLRLSPEELGKVPHVVQLGLAANERLRAKDAAVKPVQTDADVVKQRGAMFSRAAHLGSLTAAQEAALRNVHGDPETWRSKLDDFRANWKKSLVQGLFDQYAPIAQYSPKAYRLARQTKGGDSTLEALLVYGKVYVDRDGAYRVDYTRAGGMQGFAKVIAALHGEQDRFLEWVAAHRAERLKSIGLENLYSDADIRALKTLSHGNMKDGTARAAAYASALKDLNEFNDSVLKIAVDSGLIDEATRQMYKDMPYVPFYRLQEEGVAGFGMKAGLVNQSAWKKLKGGTGHLNEDLLANLLQNWSHLITASAKNRAAKATLEAAVVAKVAQEVPSGMPGKGLVGFTEAGRERLFRVSDPHLMDAVAAMHYAGLGPVAKPFIAMKRYLTIGVTVNPAFKIRNLIRDSIQAIGTAELSYNPAKNIAQGFKATEKASETRAQLLAGGGMIRFGSMLDGNNADRTRRLIEQGVDPEMILDNASKIERFWKTRVLPAFEAYQEFGDRGEQISRAALYEQLLAKGMAHEEAAFWARDLLDFSLSGKWGAVRILTQIVPFANARLQGMYKLGRATRSDYKRMGTTLGAVALASIALMLAYGDDDDWKKREDWDRDNYWWFKIGGLALRIPKPFEVGAIGTLAERTLEYFIDKEMTGKRFRDRVASTVFNQLNMNPTPQLVKPLMDIYANKDAFTGRPIETMGMERLRKQDRATEHTSEIAKFLGALGLPDPTQLAMGQWNTLSPVQIDNLVRGYFGWIGSSITTALDWGIRPIVDRGQRPDMKLRDVFLAGNFVESLPANSSRYVTQLYDQAKEIEQAYGSYQEALKRGDREKAAQIREDERDKIAKYQLVETIKRRESLLSAQAKRIEASKEIPGDEKRRRLDQIEQRKSDLARMLR